MILGSSTSSVATSIWKASAGASAQSGSTKAGQQALTPDQERQVAELQQIDRKVRAHEMAHLAAAGGLATGGATYTYTYGPDGRRYATGGEVGIDISPEEKPQDNIDKGQRVQRAALAPVDPSPQDRQVAAAGVQLEAKGRTDLAAEQRAARSGSEQPSGAGRVARAYDNGSAAGSSINVFA